MRFNGSLAPATIAVWKAWLTGSGTALKPAVQEGFHCLLNCLALTADDGLALAVDVGDHHVAVDGFQGLLDFSERRENRCHAAVVSE